MDEKRKLTWHATIDGQDATLDVYEAMWHVFQYTAIPETNVSWKKISVFLDKHLGK